MPTFLSLTKESADGLVRSYKEIYSKMIGWDGAALKYVAISVESANLQPTKTPPEHEIVTDYEGYERLRLHMDHIAREACGSEVRKVCMQP